MDDEPTVLFATSESVVESSGSLTFTITCLGVIGVGAQGYWGTLDGTATEAEDYCGSGGWLNFSFGSRTATLSIGCTDDSLAEGDEYFYVSVWLEMQWQYNVVETIIDDDSMLQLDVPAMGPLRLVAEQVSENTLQPIVSQALSLWAAADTPPQQLTTLNEVHFRVADLPGNLLGLASPGVVTIDVDAAGYGWFTDTTGTPTGGNADLLTVVLHELGHELGYDDVYDASYSGLMSATLPLDTRRLPDVELEATLAADQLFARLASAASHAEEQNWWFVDDDELFPLLR